MWYTYENWHLQIDYPTFISSINKNHIKKIIQKINIDNSPFPKSISVNNIDRNDFFIISDITSEIQFKYYSLKFDNYNDNFYPIFEQIIDSNNTLTELDLFFNTPLSWDNTLTKTFQKLKELNHHKWWSVSISWSEDFIHHYRMWKDEVNILHSMNLYGLYLKIYIIDNEELLKQIEEIILTAKFAEYTLLKKFNKWAWLDGVYKILDDWTQIKITQ